jgi:hypothetical protein
MAKKSARQVAPRDVTGVPTPAGDSPNAGVVERIVKGSMGNHGSASFWRRGITACRRAVRVTERVMVRSAKTQLPITHSIPIGVLSGGGSAGSGPVKADMISTKESTPPELGGSW